MDLEPESHRKWQHLPLLDVRMALKRREIGVIWSVDKQNMGRGVRFERMMGPWDSA